ncbi:peptidoglycan DD-metalloendopeptidase family protein [Sporomusa acidovorans]|uniref:M23ase beta-sheet core domain-containing protein n=1 Tax=Sporomusa acidovorans (strain ATCC 49682 / DSM 3132 / Mol) TaxID=1123286 RepID=A0ABZ3JBX2_SPOA4|nr:peptidoglycan DD-metalloendopeptidase family protein [Sporomusa acidovorans]OZC22672.1 murein hydrolase activator EnvC precursor [Sporomusa acidovorans DSM 3132]SDE77690.1 Murein DD-endopeptidase MepM and murein hydrolase activator NlpD, contain LysM domain [Sporomusa acidovorans]
MIQKTPKPDKREYTFMIVPHHGKSVFSIRIPIKTIKYTAATLGICLAILSGTMINYRYQANLTNQEKYELNQLREVNSKQHAELEELAKETADLQQDMNRLNQLDADLRRMVNSEDLTDTSRSAPARLTNYNGQGGPEVHPQTAELLNLVKELKVAVNERENSLRSLQGSLIEKKERLSATPSIWPTNGEVTSRFGWRNSPWGRGSDWHPGIDIANEAGTPIVATADGVVVNSSWVSGYGNMVEIDHGNGMVSIYGHNAQLLVNVGQQVKKGQLIARMGSTGDSTGPHVHYEIRVNGTAVNPSSFL